MMPDFEGERNKQIAFFFCAMTQLVHEATAIVGHVRQQLEDQGYNQTPRRFDQGREFGR